MFVVHPGMSMSEHVLHRCEFCVGESQSFYAEGVVVNQRSRSLQEHRVV
jgi:hypothetical protein